MDIYQIIEDFLETALGGFIGNRFDAFLVFIFWLMYTEIKSLYKRYIRPQKLFPTPKTTQLHKAISMAIDEATLNSFCQHDIWKKTNDNKHLQTYNKNQLVDILITYSKNTEDGFFYLEWLICNKYKHFNKEQNPELYKLLAIIEDYKEMQKSSPEALFGYSDQPLINKANDALKTKNFEKAIEFATLSLENAYKHPETHYLLGKIFFKQWQQSHKPSHPNSLLYNTLRSFETVLFLSTINITLSSNIISRFIKYWQLKWQLNMVYKALPKNYSAYNRQSKNYYHLCWWGEHFLWEIETDLPEINVYGLLVATEAYAHAWQLKQGFQVKYGLLLAYYWLGKYATQVDKEKSLRWANGLAPDGETEMADVPKAWLQVARAFVYHNFGQFEKAIGLYEESQRLDPPLFTECELEKRLNYAHKEQVFDDIPLPPIPTRVFE